MNLEKRHIIYKNYYLSSDHYIRFFQPPNSAQLKALAGKRKLNLNYSALPLFNRFGSSNSSATATAREAVLAAIAIRSSLRSTTSLSWNSKNFADWLSRALDLSDTRGASALQNKLSPVSSGSQCRSRSTFRYLQDLLPSILHKSLVISLHVSMTLLGQTESGS